MSNKRGLTLVFILFAVSIILTSFVSAGFFDWFNEMTGEAVSTVGLNISVGAGSAPQIVIVNNNTAFDGTLFAGPDSTSISLNFTVYDSNGAANINTTSATVNVSLSGEALRQNTSCESLGAFEDYYVNFSCTFDMWWFDSDGIWTVHASVSDLNGNYASNTSTVIIVNPSTGFTSGPATLTFSGINAGSTNTTATTELLLNNTGNQNIGAGGISINATSLLGETDNSRGLYSSNFSIGPDTTGTNECDTSGATATKMSDVSGSAFVAIGTAALPNGNYSVNDGSIGQEQLYFCLTYVGSEITEQIYSTQDNGVWTIQI